jgi:hypothetical protein
VEVATEGLQVKAGGGLSVGIGVPDGSAVGDAVGEGEGVVDGDGVGVGHAFGVRTIGLGVYVCLLLSMFTVVWPR